MDRMNFYIVDFDIQINYTNYMPKLIPPEIIQKIIKLRKTGHSLPEIYRETGVGYGSVARYIKGVEILPEYKKLWHGKQGGSIRRMMIREQKAEERAKKTIYSLTMKEKMIFLVALYWGEGSKADFNLMNSDPELIKGFVIGLQDVFGVSKDRIKISIRIYEDLDKDQCLTFWSKTTGVPVNKIINVQVIKGRKKGKLPYGMCRVRLLKGGDMLKYMKALRKTISAYFAPVA